MSNVGLSSYGQYAKSNNGRTTLREDRGGITLWYSYDTVVAFKELGRRRKVSENVWSTTTGKHLNWIDGGDKKNRLEGAKFRTALEAALFRQHINPIMERVTSQ